MFEYTFSDGHKITSKLSAKEVQKRMDRLSNLIAMVEELSDNPVYSSIYRKALNAYNKTDNFTGIIRLTFTEKDNLSYLLDREFNSSKDIETIRYFLRG